MTSTPRPPLLRPSLASFFVIAFFIVAAWDLVAPSPARADTPFARTIDANLFQPAIGPRNFLTLDGADVSEHKRFSLGLTLNYQRRPYSMYPTGTTTGTA